MSKRPIRIANFSGALGDWFQALAAAVRGEAVDVVIGDYLAEVTMAMVASGFLARPEPTGLSSYYCDMFLHQLLPELKIIADRRIKVIVNAGAFNPAGLAEAIRAAAAERSLTLRVAYTLGDDLLPQLPTLVAEGQVQNLDTGLPIGTVASSRRWLRAPTSSSAAGFRMPRWLWGRLPGGTVGGVTTGTALPEPWLPVMSSSAARRRPADNSRASSTSGRPFA
jgi:hypothetical protein